MSNKHLVWTATKGKQHYIHKQKLCAEKHSEEHELGSANLATMGYSSQWKMKIYNSELVLNYLLKVGEWEYCAVEFWYGRLAHGCKLFILNHMISCDPHNISHQTV